MKTLLPLCLFSLLFCVCAPAAADAPMPLWPDGAPGAQGSGEGHEPTLTPCFPAKDIASGAAVVVCPGGGYAHLAADYEGDEVAAWLARNGVAGFTLRYRHTPDYLHPVPLMDAQRAIRTVRANAAAWGIDPERIGILGFSAGGHLSASAGTLFEPGAADAADPIERVSSRPDFMVLIYPVISMTEPFMHRGSRNNLLGKDAPEELALRMSLEKQVTAETAPAFLVSSWTDKGVPCDNTIAMFQALKKAGVPAEMHVYEPGPHGFGMGKGDPILSTWTDLCINWFRTRGILPKQ